MSREGLRRTGRVAGKLLLRGILSMAILVGMMVWLSGGFRRERPASASVVPRELPPPGASVYLVSLSACEQFAEAIGEIQTEAAINVSSKVTAHITEIPIHAGESVHRGQVLVQLDARDLDARVKQAQQALEHAMATRDYARQDLARTEFLYKKGVIAQADLDMAQMNWKESQAEALRLTEALDEARVTRSYAQITSPVDGIIIDRLAEVGDLAVPGKVLLVLFDPQRVWLQASVQEQDVKRLTLGQTYRMHIDALNADVSGPLVEIVPSADPNSRTVLARVRLTPDIPVYPGMFGRLLLPLGQQQQMLIPQSAVRQVGQLHMVDVLVGQQVEQRLVVLGKANESRQVEVLSGLNVGDRIVLRQAPTGEQP